MHTKFQKNTPKNKISVQNTNLQVMQTRRTLTTWSTVMRQLHVLHVLIEVRSVERYLYQLLKHVTEPETM